EGSEIASFIGNISQFEDDVYLHCHIVLGRSDFSTLSGHCHEAVVGATFEGVIFKGTSDVSRVFSEEIGLNLYKF
ncbi:MAG: PCC domain-containing protein, partial [Candidatus Kariarchaeaceae archaeon]